MKRHLVYYSTGALEQVSEMNKTLERQVNLGIISFIVDTQLGTVFGKSGNPQAPAQWFDIPADEPELITDKAPEVAPEENPFKTNKQK
jgi:hypothetical protein